jgi:hypothetical protein
MEQLQIKYRDEIIKKLDPLDIYNNTLTYLKTQQLKDSLLRLIIVISAYVIVKQTDKKDVKFIETNVLNIFAAIGLVLVIYWFSGFLEQSEDLLNLIDNKDDIKLNDLNSTTNNNKLEGLKFYKYDITNNVIEDNNGSILDILKDIIKVLIIIFAILTLLNMFITSYTKFNKSTQLLYITFYIVIFTIIFYYLVVYLFENYNNKQENNLKNKLSLLQILSKQLYNEGITGNDLHRFSFLIDKNQNPIIYKIDGNYTNEEIKNFKLDGIYYNHILNIFIENAREEDKVGNIKNLRDAIVNCFTEQEKKSIISPIKEIVDPLNDSKNILNKDNNRYEIEVHFTDELTNFFHLLFQSYDGYRKNFYSGNGLTEFYDDNLDDSSIIYNKTNPSITIIVSALSSDVIKKIRLPDSSSRSTMISFISNDIIESKNETYKVYNLYDKKTIFENRFRKIADGMYIHEESDQENNKFSFKSLIDEINNKDLYEIINVIITYCNYSSTPSVLYKNEFTHKLSKYIKIQGINYDNIYYIFNYYFKHSTFFNSTANSDQGYTNESIFGKYESNPKSAITDIFNAIIDSYNTELDEITKSIDILDKIFNENKNSLISHINTKEAEDYYNKYLIIDKPGLNEYDIKKEYFKSEIIKEIDLFNTSIKTMSISEEDLKLFKNNELSEYKYSLYIYKYYIKEFVNIFLNNDENAITLDDITNITNEKIYRVFLNELNKYKSNARIDEEKLLKNYKRIFKFLISKYQREDIKQCMSTLELDTNLKGLSKYITKDLFNQLLLDKDKKFFYNECCKYDKLEENFIVKYKPLIEYELQNKIIDKNLILNIINIFLYLTVSIVGLYLFQGFLSGLFSDKNITAFRNNLFVEFLKLIKLTGIHSNYKLILRGLFVFIICLICLPFIPIGYYFMYCTRPKNKGHRGIIAIGGIFAICGLYYLFMKSFFFDKKSDEDGYYSQNYSADDNTIDDFRVGTGITLAFVFVLSFVFLIYLIVYDNVSNVNLRNFIRNFISNGNLTTGNLTTA